MKWNDARTQSCNFRTCLLLQAHDPTSHLKPSSCNKPSFISGVPSTTACFQPLSIKIFHFVALSQSAFELQPFQPHGKAVKLRVFFRAGENIWSCWRFLKFSTSVPYPILHQFGFSDLHSKHLECGIEKALNLEGELLNFKFTTSSDPTCRKNNCIFCICTCMDI